MVYPADSLPPAARRIAVLGLGFAGLPMAVALARTGLAVTAFDVDAHRVAKLRAGESYIPDVRSGDLRAATSLTATSDPDELHGCDMFIICVPTPATGSDTADLGYLQNATVAVAGALRAGALVVIQSTVPVGTTRQLAEKLSADAGLTLGGDLFVAYVPERIDPANRARWGLHNTPRVVAGLTPACRGRATALLAPVVPVLVPASSVEVAELAKLFENTFRLINIALAMQLGEVCERTGVPVREVIEAAATKPYAFVPHFPSAGVGGECIPVDPLFLLSQADTVGADASLVHDSFRVVRGQPERVARRALVLVRTVPTRATVPYVVLAGVTYKADVPDVRNAPAAHVAQHLISGGARVAFWDPYVPSFAAADGSAVTRIGWEEIGGADLVVLTTAHSAFLTSDRPPGFPPVLDCAGVLPAGPGIIHL